MYLIISYVEFLHTFIVVPETFTHMFYVLGQK